MPKPKKLKLMVASTIYGFQDQLRQICAVLHGYGYEVWNSDLGTAPVNPGLSNLASCVAAARDCDVFLGIIRPFYGTGVVGARSITHEECRTALKFKKPRWFLVHHDVTVARQLLKPYLYGKGGKRTKFVLKKNPVLDDIRVIELYNEMIQDKIPVGKRTGHWVQEFFRVDEALLHIDAQFKNVARVQEICKKMSKP